MRVTRSTLVVYNAATPLSAANNSSRTGIVMASTHIHHAHENSTANDYGRAFAIGIALNVGFVLVEWISGVYAQSLALIADASHNLGDVLSLLLAWGAAHLATRKPSARFTYGLRSSTILAALTNAMLLLVVSGGIAWEAWLRLQQPACRQQSGRHRRGHRRHCHQHKPPLCCSERDATAT